MDPSPLPLYPSYPAAELLRTNQLSKSRALIVEDPKMFAMLRGAPVEHIILLTGEAEGAMSLATLRGFGRYAAEINADDNAILYLTSGATGDPKRVVVSHGLP